MVTTNLEELLTFAEAREIVPGRPHVATLQRWRLNGIRDPHGKRVKLRATRVGGKLMLSRADIHDFLNRLNPEHSAAESSASASEPGRAAGRALEALGC